MKSTASQNPEQNPIAPAPKWSGLDRLAFVLATVLAGVVFLNTLHGEWVYDDERQIVKNLLIQDPGRLGEALMSDVWAFKGGPEGYRVSNYWRPTFVGWIALHYRAFGLDSTTAWHATNVLLHMLTTALVFVLARRVGLTTALAAAGAVVFAVHPVHVESVAWISGSPDLLLAPLLLGAMLLLLRSFGPRGGVKWGVLGGATGLFVLAQGSKEVALFFPIIACAAMWAVWQGDGRAFRAGALVRVAPLALVSIAYVVARPMVIGKSPPGAYADVDLGALIWNAPQVAAFYLRQSLFPLEIGPSYPMRDIGDAGLTMANFWIPLLVCAVAGAAMLLAARAWRIALLGLAIWVFTLGPAMNIGAFHPEQVVHDRYLYLPLLGLLLVLLPAAGALAGRLAGSPARGAGAVLVVFAAAAVPLAAQTWRYNSAWMSDVALWEWGVRSDPTSAFNANQLAVALHEAARGKDGRFDAAMLERARAAADESLRLDPDMLNARMVRSEIFIEQGRFAEAERDLGEALRIVGEASTYEVAQIYQRLAVAHERQGRLAAAEAVLREARNRLPQYRCMMTHMLAVTLYGQGRKAEALAELESVRDAVAAETNVDSRLVLFRLGLLYEEQRRGDAARAAYADFLRLSVGLRDPGTLGARKLAEQRVKALGG